MLFSWQLANRQSAKKHNKYQLLYIYSIPPDDGLQICPKHVEVDWRSKLRINSASSWFLLHRYMEMNGQQNIKSSWRLVLKYFFYAFVKWNAELTWVLRRNCKTFSRHLYAYLFLWPCKIRISIFLIKNLLYILTSYTFIIYYSVPNECLWLSRDELYL